MRCKLCQRYCQPGTVMQNGELIEEGSAILNPKCFDARLITVATGIDEAMVKSINKRLLANLPDDLDFSASQVCVRDDTAIING